MNLWACGTRSSFVSDVLESHERQRQIACIVQPLQKIYDRYCSYDTEVHFCKIDVEGFEREVLKGIDFTRLRPWLMVVEATVPGTAIPCHEDWEYLLFENGYQFAFQSGIR